MEPVRIIRSSSLGAIEIPLPREFDIFLNATYWANGEETNKWQMGILCYLNTDTDTTIQIYLDTVINPEDVPPTNILKITDGYVGSELPDILWYLEVEFTASKAIKSIQADLDVLGSGKLNKGEGKRGGRTMAQLSTNLPK